MKPSSLSKRRVRPSTKPAKAHSKPQVNKMLTRSKKLTSHRRSMSTTCSSLALSQPSQTDTCSRLSPTTNSLSDPITPSPTPIFTLKHSTLFKSLITTTRRNLTTTILTNDIRSNGISVPNMFQTVTPAPLGREVLLRRPRSFFSTSPNNGQIPFSPQQMSKFQDLIDNEAESPDGFFDDDEESDGPMTEPEDLHQYTRDFDQDNIRPELFNPQTHLTEFMIATLLQGEIDAGIPMFPIYLRGPVFRKIISTLDRITRSGHGLDENIITKVMSDVFTNYAPEICRTHEHALNLLFPMAPRLGDVVQLPTVTGHSIVSKREYIDNRDGFDDDTATNMKENDDEDIGRFMVITYTCLHPTLRGKSFVSKHPFDSEVYTITMRRDERALEKLMHERGMIDMYSGRIANVLEQAGKIPGLTGAGSQPLMIQQRADKDSNQLHRIEDSAPIDRTKHMKVLSTHLPAPKVLEHRPQELIAPDGQNLMIPGPGDLDGKPQQLQEKKRELIGDGRSPTSSSSSSSSPSPHSSPHSLQSSAGHVPATLIDGQSGQLSTQPQYTVKVADPSDYLPKDQKHYYQNLVLTGDKAAFMYRQLVQELAQGKSKFDGRGGQPGNVDVLRQQLKGKVTIDDIKNHGAVNAKLGAKGAMYGPDAFADFGEIGESVVDVGSVPNFGHAGSFGHGFGQGNIVSGATTPNQVMSIRQQQKLDQEIEAGLDEVVAASSGSSKYFKQYQEMKQVQREELKASIKKQETKTFGEIHAEKQQEMNCIEHLKDKFNALIQYHVENGKSLEEAQVLADNQFDPETGEIDLDAKIGENDADTNADHSNLPDSLKSSTTTTKKPTEPDTDALEFDAQSAYTALPDNYKKKYKHIIIKDGPGAGLPDPLAIDYGEDLFEIYPQANIALMDFLSDQWSLMVKEKQDQIQLDADRQLQKEDAAREKVKKQKEYLRLHPGSTLNSENQVVDAQGNTVDLSEEDDYNAARNRFLNETNEHDTNRMELPKDVESTRYRLLAAVAAAGQLAFTADYVSALFERVGKYEQDSEKEKQERYVPMKVSGDGLEFAQEKANDDDKAENENTQPNTQEQSNQKDQSPPKPKRNLDLEPDFQYLVQQQEFKRLQRERQEAIERGEIEAKNNPEAQEAYDAEVVPEYVPPTTTTSVSITPEGYVKYGDKLLTQMEYAEQIFGKKPIPIEKSNVVPAKMKQMILDHHRYRDELEKKKTMATVTERLTGNPPGQSQGGVVGQGKRRYGTVGHHHSNLPQKDQNGHHRHNLLSALSYSYPILSVSTQLQQTVSTNLTSTRSPQQQHQYRQKQRETQIGFGSPSLGTSLLANRNSIFTSQPATSLKI